MPDAVEKLLIEALAGAKGRGVFIECTFDDNNRIMIMTHIVDGKRLSYVGLTKDEVEKFTNTLQHAAKLMRG